MSMFEDYKTRMESTKGESLRQKKIKATQNAMDRKFMSFPTAGEFEVLEPNSTEKTTCRLRIIHDLNMKQMNPERRHSLSFIVHPKDKITAGTIVYDYDGKDWLIVSLSNVGTVHQQGIMFRVNQNLKWMDGTTVRSTLAVFFTTSYTSSAYIETQTINLPSEPLKFMVPINANTDSINRDLRIVVNKSPYKVTRIDDYTDEGIYHIYVKEDQFEAEDDVTQGIANFKEHHEDTTVHIDGPEAITFHETATYTIANTEEQALSWNLLQDKQWIKIVDSTPTQLDLKIDHRVKTTGQQITIVASLPDSTIEKIITIKSLL